MNYIQIDNGLKAQVQQLDFNVDYVFAFAGLAGTASSELLIKRF